ncbi:MAG: type II toxin-antitoxin system VapC family toxin [Pseudomonadota bacterium]
MIGLDTNVLVRHLIQDDPEQSPRASAALDACTTEVPGYLNRIVLCELVWVLDRAYGYGREQIAPVLEALLRSADLRVEDEGLAWRALDLYRGGADFADALLALSNREAGAEETLTFDRRAAALPGFFSVS